MLYAALLGHHAEEPKADNLVTERSCKYEFVSVPSAVLGTWEMGKIWGLQCSNSIWAAWWKYNYEGCLEARAQIELCTREQREGSSSASNGEVGNGQGKQLDLVCYDKGKNCSLFAQLEWSLIRWPSVWFLAKICRLVSQSSQGIGLYSQVTLQWFHNLRKLNHDFSSHPSCHSRNSRRWRTGPKVPLRAYCPETPEHFLWLFSFQP